MNDEIVNLFTNFTVAGKAIPVKFARYIGTADTYVIFQNTHDNDPLEGDGELLGVYKYYDFDVYSKNNYRPILNAIRQTLWEAGWIYCPTLCGPDMFDEQTGFYHKTIVFKKEEML